MRRLALPDEILMKVEKPARYIGGEYNSVMKDKDKVDVRFCMCFPDVYEIGMSHLGIQICSTGERTHGVKEFIRHGLIWTRR